MEGLVGLDPQKKRNVWANAWAATFGKYLINVLLACVAVALEVYYSVCGGSCSYLKGDLIGIPLQYVGIAYMACIVLVSLLKADTLLLMLLSAGVGIEVYLVGFQIWHSTYCPYCLAFGAVVFILFLLNLNRNRKRLSFISMGLALILFSVFFEGSATPSYAEETLIPTFGQGRVNVRLYTDYFCPPCRAMEPDVEPLLADLIEKNRINVTFIDTPFYQYSSLYAKYYLYAMNDKSEFEHALATRAALVEGAKQNINERGRIEMLLADKGTRIKPFDARPVFDVFGRFLKEDGITSTPTCVIEKNAKKEKVSGKADIINALKGLR
jgi:thiol:disulfide interchange protein DsbA